MCNDCKFHLEQYIIPPIANIVFQYNICIHKEILEELKFPLHQIKNSKTLVHINTSFSVKKDDDSLFCDYKTINFYFNTKGSENHWNKQFLNDVGIKIYKSRFWLDMYNNITDVYFAYVQNNKKNTKQSWYLICQCINETFVVFKATKVEKLYSMKTGKWDRTRYVYNIYITKEFSSALQRCAHEMSLNINKLNELMNNN
jgi:hypothetical protein